MLSICLLSALLAVRVAATPQNINFANLDPVQQGLVTVPIGVPAQSFTYNPTAAALSVAAAITNQPKAVKERSQKPDTLVERTPAACAAYPASLYTGPTPADDAADFLAFPAFASTANSAPVPAGYLNTFINLHASSSALGYMGFTELATYDTVGCAAKCSAITGCMAINIYFERDPSLNAAAACPNPPSITVIKCVYWGGPVNAANALNTGQYVNNFQVVIAGSNGYVVSNTVATPPGYSSPTSLGNASINAPTDCNGLNTFMGSKLFTGTPFDPALCATACTATSAYDVAHPPATGLPQTCQSFNTYILYLNGVAQGQVCAMYTESWSPTYAVNTGYQSGSNIYTIGSSYSFSNATSPAYASACVPTPTGKSYNGFAPQGCYTDHSPARGLLGPEHASWSSMTLEFCSNYCQGYKYFSVENGEECKCGNVLQPQSQPAPSTSCNTPCTGNSGETCGGFWFMNVYQNPNPGPLPLVNGLYAYQGCYKDGISNRGLQGPLSTGSKITLEYCATFCAGFPYFGVENANQCFCGNTLEGSSVLDPTNSGCNSQCTGNSSETCGGFGLMNVYANQAAVAAKPTTIDGYTYQGCYTDSWVRTLGNVAQYGVPNLTYEYCANVCNAAGYIYFGVEFGVECYCGNSILSSAVMVADSSSGCNYKCAGNNAETCGGFFYINVFGKNNLISSPGNPGVRTTT